MPDKSGKYTTLKMPPKLVDQKHHPSDGLQKYIYVYIYMYVYIDN
jgi:hypothetical protein